MRSPSFWCACESVVFLNPVQRAITTIVGDFTTANLLLRPTVDPANDQLAGEFYSGLPEHLADAGQAGELWRARFDVIEPFPLPASAAM